MKRWIVGVALVVLLLIAGIVVAGAVRPPTATGPTYTVGQSLSRAPWQRLRWRNCIVWGQQCLRLGQSVRVRGVLQPIPNGRSATPLEGSLFGTAASATHGVGLAVYYGPPDSLVARLRAVPLIARLIPLPPTADHPLLGRLATYRLHVIRCQTFDPLCPVFPRSLRVELADGGTP